MQLRAMLPEGLPAETPACSWVLRDKEGRIVEAGDGMPNAMPASDTIQLIAPAARVLLTSLDLPKRLRVRTPQFLRFAVEDRIAVDAERVHTAMDGSSHGTGSAAVVDRDWLAAWVGAFDGAGRNVQSVRIETCLPPYPAGAWTVVWNGGDGFVRTGSCSGMALDVGSTTTPPATLTLLLQQATTQGQRPDKLLVWSAPAGEPDLTHWSAALGIACEAAPAWDWRDEPQLGGIELLQGEFAPRRKRSDAFRRFKPAAAIAALIVLVHVLGTAVHAWQLHREKEALKHEMLTAFRGAFPDARAIVDPALQMQRQVEVLRRGTGEARFDDFLPLLAQGAAAFDTGSGVRLKTLSFEGSKLLLDVEMGSAGQAQALLARMQGGPAPVALAAVDSQGTRVVARFVFGAGTGG